MFIALGMSFATYEFPALIGGMIGCVMTAGLIRFQVGLKEYVPEDGSRHPHEISTTSDAHSVITSFIREKDESIRTSARASRKESLERDGVDTFEDVVEEGEGFLSNTEKASDCFVVRTAEINSEQNNANGNEPETANKEDWEPEPLNRSIAEKEKMTDSQKVIEQALGPRKSYAEGYIREVSFYAVACNQQKATGDVMETTDYISLTYRFYLVSSQ